MSEESKYQEPPKGSKIFLYLAAFMMLLAVLSYAFENWLFDLYYSDSTFVYAITISVILALLFLYFYRLPRIGYKLLGRRLEAEREPKSKVPAVTYDIFKDEMGSDVALRHHRRKKARQLRHRLAREDRQKRQEGQERPERPDDSET